MDLNQPDDTVLDRVGRSGANTSLDNMLVDIEEATYTEILNFLINSADPNVQSVELESYVSGSIIKAITLMNNSGMIDGRFNLVPPMGNPGFWLDDVWTPPGGIQYV